MYRKGWPAFIAMLAICSLGLAVGFSFADDGFSWFWAGAPWVAAVLLAVSLGCAGLLLFLRRQRT